MQVQLPWWRFWLLEELDRFLALPFEPALPYRFDFQKDLTERFDFQKDLNMEEQRGKFQGRQLFW